MEQKICQIIVMFDKFLQFLANFTVILVLYMRM